MSEVAMRWREEGRRVSRVVERVVDVSWDEPDKSGGDRAPPLC